MVLMTPTLAGTTAVEVLSIFEGSIATMEDGVMKMYRCVDEIENGRGQARSPDVEG